MTTASTATNVPFRENRLLQVLCVLFVAVWIWSGINPIMVEDWWLENGLVFLFAGVLIATYKRFSLSQLSYLMIFIYLSMHEWGSHYRYALDPFGEWLKQFQVTTRNQFDRWVHAAFGLLMYYPWRELLIRRANLKQPWSSWIPVFILLAFGAGYELVEAIAAAILSNDAGDAFLGLQGDPWDTHKDMFMALAGGTTSMVVTFIGVRIRAARTKRLTVTGSVATIATNGKRRRA
jgi:putative membrane protein